MVRQHMANKPNVTVEDHVRPVEPSADIRPAAPQPPVQDLQQLAEARFNIDLFMIRMGLWGMLYYNDMTEPQNPILIIKAPALFSICEMSCATCDT